MPKWNEKDLVDIPKNVQEDIQFYFVDKMLDVIDIAINRMDMSDRRQSNKDRRKKKVVKLERRKKMAAKKKKI